MYETLSTTKLKTTVQNTYTKRGWGDSMAVRLFALHVTGPGSISASYIDSQPHQKLIHHTHSVHKPEYHQVWLQTKQKSENGCFLLCLFSKNYFVFFQKLLFK